MNIEEEMKLMHQLQLSGAIQNPLTLFFDGDKTTVITSSYESYYISHTHPFEDLENGRCTYIRGFYVPKSIRRKGVGKSFIDGFIIVLKNIGIKKVEVEATDDSLLFWESFGFKLNGEPDLRMVLELN